MYKSPRQSLFSFILFTSSLFSLSTNQAQALQSAISSGENLDLYGISIHSEQRNDIYVGALFSSTKVDKASQLLSPEISKRMSLKFVSKYSSRKMARLWKQRIAMNNPKSKWQPMTQEIVRFAGIFKRAMQEGDELNLDFDPTSGTSVYLNGTLFLTIPENDFYDLLLKVWIGSIPPTKNFKIGISGKNKSSTNDKLISQYQSLQPELGRFDEDKPLETESDQIAKSEEQKPAEKEIPAKIQQKQQQKSAKNSVKPAKKNSENQEALAEKSKSQKETDALVSKLKADLPPSKVPVAAVAPSLELGEIQIGDLGAAKKDKIQAEIKKEEKPVVVKEQVAKKEEKLEPPSPQKQQVEKKQPVAEEKVALLDIPKQESFDADLYSGSYTRELVSKIRKVQWYPKKALVAGEQGEVKILVTIDKEGNVVDKTITQRSGSRTLDRNALKMVGKAQPFPVIPDELDTEQFEFEVPLNFTLRN